MRHPLENKSFVEWLELQPADKKYNYDDGGKCAICQYFNAVGIPFRTVMPTHWYDWEGRAHPIPDGWNDVARANRMKAIQTFGAAAKKARATLLA